MIICKRSVHHQGVLEFLCHWLIVLLNFISTWVLMYSKTKFKEQSRGICYSVTHHDGVAHPLVSINRKLIKWQIDEDALGNSCDRPTNKAVL